ncbi:MAG TPA: hypothetical protein VFD82_21225 [Planctomycetota bacterium]|nr:hypothetical protein [Planctomycetota bacterium]
MKLNLDPDRRVMRQFAWASLVLFPAVAGFLSWQHDLPRAWVVTLIGIGVLVAVVELVLVDLLGSFGALLEKLIPRALFQILSVVAFPIGFVLSHVLMAAIFFLVMTPIGLCFRLFSRDALGRKLEPNRTSYWRDRGPARDASSYFKLY